ERHAHLLGRKTERLGEVVADLDRECLAEVPFVAVTAEIQLERLRLDAELARPILHAGNVEIRLLRNRADRGQLVADHLDPRDTRIGEGLQPGVVIGARLAQSDEIGRAGIGSHRKYCRWYEPATRRPV